MNSLVVYFSKFGHTRKIADTIAETLQSVGTVQSIEITQLSVSDFQDIDLVVIGTPTHKMNLPEAVTPVFERLPKRVLKKVPAAAFDTSYKMSSFLARFTAAKKLAQKLRKLGGKRIVPPETFYVEGREGPLFDGEIERAREWSNTILEQLNGKGDR